MSNNLSTNSEKTPTFQLQKQSNMLDKIKEPQSSSSVSKSKSKSNSGSSNKSNRIGKQEAAIFYHVTPLNLTP